MVAWAKQSVSSPVCENAKFFLLDGRSVAFDRSYPLRDITASMRLADTERVVVQAEAGTPATCRGSSEGDTCDGIEGNGLDTGRFGKKFWRPAAWQSLSAPPSPTPMALQPACGIGDIRKAFPLTPRAQPQSGKLRPPPLQPPRRSTEGNGVFDESSLWLPATPGGRRDIRGLMGPEMKLDLVAVQRNRDTCEPTEMQLKRDKFAFFDKECSRIVEHIYLGSDAVARNRETLREKGITHVLNCVGFVCPEYFPKDLIYKTLWLQDSPSEDITSVLYDVFDYFEEVREEGGRVFVHCCQGVSRSTSLVIAYLMWRDGRTFEDAFQDVKAARGVTNPNMGFACQLLQCQKRVHAAPVSPNSVLRMYRMASHSPYDPMHLVPKTVNHPDASALDSRGAFVVHVPSALFAWQGSKCDIGMAAAACHFTSQVVRYEKAHGNIVQVLEGEEPIEFWEALGKGSRSFSPHSLSVGKENGTLKSGSGSSSGAESGGFPKRVSIYDDDFETYHRAKNGNFVPKVTESGLMTQVPRDSGWSRQRQEDVDELEIKIPRSQQASESNLEQSEEMLQAAEAKPDVPEEAWAGSRTTSSPNASQCSSASPFSLHSFSSTSSQSPPFLTSPCMSPPPSPTISFSRIPTPNCSLMWSPTTSQMRSPTTDPSSHVPFLSIDNLSSQLDSQPAKGSPSKGPMSSLAERRGSVLSSLNLPTVSDENSPSTKGSLHLPTISSESIMVCDPMALETSSIGFGPDAPETYRQVSGVCESSERLADSSKASSTSQREDIAETSSRGGSKDGEGSAVPSLFEWPQMERIDMFDADDLDSDAAYVLLVPDTSEGTGGHLYLWVGSSLQPESDGNSSAGDGDVERRNEEDWQNIGADLARRLHLRQDAPVQVIVEGKEPHEFWDNFVNG